MNEYFTEGSAYVRRTLGEKITWYKELEGRNLLLEEGAYVSPERFNSLMNDFENGRLSEDGLMKTAEDNGGFKGIGGYVIYRCRNSKGETEMFHSGKVIKIH